MRKLVVNLMDVIFAIVGVVVAGMALLTLNANPAGLMFVLLAVAGVVIALSFWAALSLILENMEKSNEKSDHQLELLEQIEMRLTAMLTAIDPQAGRKAKQYNEDHRIP